MQIARSALPMHGYRDSIAKTSFLPSKTSDWFPHEEGQTARLQHWAAEDDTEIEEHKVQR